MPADSLYSRSVVKPYSGLRRGRRRVRRGHSEETTFLPALLDGSIITKVTEGRKNLQEGCTRMAIFGQCICCIIRKFERHTMPCCYASFSSKGLRDI
jgi:hypothetical protein